jgi:hypothetical protein
VPDGRSGQAGREPLQGFAASQISVTPSLTSRSPSQGSPCLSERPARRSGSFLRRTLRVVSTTTRCSADQSVPARRGLATASPHASRHALPDLAARIAWTAPTGLGPSQGSHCVAHPGLPTWVPLLGFRAPSTACATGSASPGDRTPRLVPSSRFFTSATVSSPVRLAVSQDRCRSWGSPLRDPFG